MKRAALFQVPASFGGAPLFLVPASFGGAPDVSPLRLLWALLFWVPASFGGSVAAAQTTQPADPAPPPIRFRDASAAWHLDFRHHHAGSGQYYMIETMGSGLVVFDYDGDGDEDVLMLDGAPLPGYVGEAPRTRLFRNDRVGQQGGRFVDVTGAAGLEVAVYAMGAAAGDVDGDGDLDLYISGFGVDQLFANQGDGTFRDSTARAGLGNPLLGASAAFADVDRDGDLDLYVANYVDFSFDHNPVCGNQQKGIRTYCHPDAFTGARDVFYDNRGDGTFVERTAEAGFGEADGNGLGVVFGDIDEDGWPDLFVANDMTPNFVFRNRGRSGADHAGFEELGLISGVALNDRGNPEASMGVDLGDLDGDLRPELAATHMDVQTNALYGYLGSWLFVDKRYISKLAEPSIGLVGFGVAFLDLDQDGWLDVVVANGHIIDNIEKLMPRQSFRQPNQVFRNLGRGVFEQVDDAGLTTVRASRGLATGDLDGDGDLDLVINNSNDLAELWQNVTEAGGFLLVEPRLGGGNRNAIGARVEVVTGERTQRREVRTGVSYMSQHAMPVHFGLAAATSADVLRVVWPQDGTVTEIRGLPADVRVRVMGSADAQAPREASARSPAADGVHQ